MAFQILWKSSFITRFGSTSTSSSSLIDTLYHHTSPSFFRLPLSSLFSTSSSFFLNSHPLSSSTTTTKTTSNRILFQQQRQLRSLLWCSKYSSTTPACVDTETEGFGKAFLELTDEELVRQCKMNFTKSSGPGGQHRNKRETAVRLTHLPTGIVAQVNYFSVLLLPILIWYLDDFVLILFS